MQNNKETYFEAAKTWRDDKYYSSQVRLRRSYLLNIALLLLLLISGLTLMLLLPLKRTVPFVISHNQTTGEITQLGELKPTHYNNDWTLTRYFLIRYITNRENFHSDNVDRPYQIAYAMSDKVIAAVYDKQVDSNNPKAPYNVYGQHRFVTVHVNSIARLNDNTAEVHFDKTIHDKTSGQTMRIPMIAIIKWSYVDTPATQKTLDRNPLGFQVTYYQLSQVTL